MFNRWDSLFLKLFPKDVQESLLFIKDELNCSNLMQVAHAVLKTSAKLLEEMSKGKRICLLSENGDLSEFVWEGNPPDPNDPKFNN